MPIGHNLDIPSSSGPLVQDQAMAMGLLRTYAAGHCDPLLESHS